KTGRLKPGYTVDLEIVSIAVKSRLVIPYEALVENDGEKKVWVCENSQAHLRTVATGVEGELYLEVTGGLDKDELIIVDPPNGLKEGQQVRHVAASAALKDNSYD
ncbi:MAG: hypothetical protein WCY82_11255, partial [Desulfotomaculaceae bacterium]